MWRRILDSPWTFFGLAGVLLVGGILSQVEFRLPVRPVGTIEQMRTLRERDDLNVVFILLDTLRADRLHGYGYERKTSPYMDFLASTGIRFRRCVAQSSWTKSSMASLWTGTYPRVNGVMRWSHALPKSASMPAEILQEAGFVTAGMHRNGWVGAKFGFDQGFSVYYKPRPGAERKQLQRKTQSSHVLGGTDQDVTENAIEFLRAHAHERFLLYLHYMDIHQYTYDQESEKFGTDYSDAYDNSISWVDRNIGVLLETLEKTKLSDQTLLVIASDHGEAFREHNTEGHGTTLYREVVEVPLIVALPFRLEPGVVVDSIVQNIDIWPTVLDLLGLPPMSGAQGRSLVPLIEAAAAGAEGSAAESERPAFAHMDRLWGEVHRAPYELMAVTTDTHRLIQGLQGEGERFLRLYDHRTDPLEQSDLAQEQPEVVAELERLGQSFLQSDAASWGAPAQLSLDELGPDFEKLRALGYVVK